MTEKENVVSIHHRYVYSIRDSKADTFTNPFLALNDKESQRIFGDICFYSGDNLISRHLDDYSLYCLGEIDIRTGSIFGYVEPKHIISARNIYEIYERETMKRSSSNLSSEDKDLTSLSSDETSSSH